MIKAIFLRLIFIYIQLKEYFYIKDYIKTIFKFHKEIFKIKSLIFYMNLNLFDKKLFEL